MKSKIIMFFVAFIVWCLLDWVPDWQHLIVGGFVSAFVTFMIGDLFITRPHVLKHPLRYWYFFAYYLPIFLWECFKWNRFRCFCWIFISYKCFSCKNK